MGRRERTTMFVGGPVLVLALLYKLAFGPSLDELQRLDTVLARKESELREVETTVKEHAKHEARIRDLTSRIEVRGRSFDLFGFIGSTASKVKIKNQCEVKLVRQPAKSELDYERSVVDVTLQGVSLKELTDFLYLIYAADKLLVVDPIEITVPSSGKGGLKVEMTISTLVRA